MTNNVNKPQIVDPIRAAVFPRLYVVQVEGTQPLQGLSANRANSALPVEQNRNREASEEPLLISFRIAAFH